MVEIRRGSPELAYEIDEKESRINGTEAGITFKNGSIIKVVTAGDTSRGNRAHILLIDEFRLVKKEVITTILKKFLANPRRPKFMDRPEYKGRKDLQESLKTMYLSSAYYKDHWSYTKTKDVCRFMLDERRKEFVCGFPYQLALKEELLSEERVIEDMTESDFNEIKWSIEMEALFWGGSGGTFFNFESVSKNRKIEFPMLPNKLSAKISGESKACIPRKANGEKRILSADIALMSSKRYQNDATAIFINQLLPTRSEKYTNNIVYTETHEGEHTEDQALRIRRLYEEYDCDYIVLDCTGVGLGVYDALVRDMVDPETGEIYPALTCCNNSVLAARCTSKTADKVIWAINGSSRFNSDCAVQLREGFKTGKVRLLIPEVDGEELLKDVKGFNSLSRADKDTLLLPYINTTLLIGELINLEHEESGGVIRIVEKSGKRKDRYSALAYNYHVACQLEQTMRKKRNEVMTREDFVFRAPKIKGRSK